MSVKKLAVFVEGQTEQIFLQSLIEEIAGKRRIDVTPVLYSARSMAALELTKKRLFRPDLEYFVLLMNCQNDEKVKSVILEQRASLAGAGYSMILGLRDLYPKALSDIPAVERGIAYGLPTAGIPTHIVLAVAEIEAWFVQDYEHYSKIDRYLDYREFKARFGFDPLLESAEALPWPSDFLHRVYGSVGKAYKKSRSHVERTVSVLDFVNLYVSYPQKLARLRQLVGYIDTFLA